MKHLRRAAPAIWLTYLIALGLAPAVFAHDCSDRTDCSVLPPNVDIATGIAAVGAGTAIGWSVLKKRNGNGRSPCQELRNEVEAGEARIKELEAKLAAAQADLERATEAVKDQPIPEPRNYIT